MFEWFRLQADSMTCSAFVCVSSSNKNRICSVKLSWQTGCGPKNDWLDFRDDLSRCFLPSDNFLIFIYLTSNLLSLPGKSMSIQNNRNDLAWQKTGRAFWLFVHFVSSSHPHSLFSFLFFIFNHWQIHKSETLTLQSCPCVDRAVVTGISNICASNH